MRRQVIMVFASVARRAVELAAAPVPPPRVIRSEWMCQ
jgi:hypothetical protein